MINKNVAVLQVRCQSARLPNKAILPIQDTNILEIIIRKSRNARLDDFWLATSIDQANDPVRNLASKYNLNCFSGSESDVLSRFIEIIKITKCENIIRLTGDNPLTSSDSINYLINCFELLGNNNLQYLSNFKHESFPIGAFGEIVNANLLLELENKKLAAHHKSHVTSFIRQHLLNEYPIPTSKKFPFRPGWRWTIDYVEDFSWFQKLYSFTDGGVIEMEYIEMVDLIDANPELLRLENSRLRKPLSSG